MPEQTNKKHSWISNLRVLATCAVILLHVSVCVAYQFGQIEAYKWWIANLFDGICHSAVPLFVMITGALLIPQDIGIKSFMQKRLKRILMPFLFWSAIYVIYNFFKDTTGIHYSFFDILKISYLKLTNGAYYHLWFVYMIIGMYLIIPILKKWVKNCSEKEMIYFLTIWAITLVFMNPIIHKYMPKVEIQFFAGFVGYLVLGYYLSTKPVEKMKNIRKIAVLIIIIGTLITVLGTWWISARQGRINELFYDYLTPNIFLIATGIFIFVKTSCFNSQKSSRLLNFIDSYSFGIYLGHILVLEFLIPYVESFLFGIPIIGIPVVAFFCLFITMGIVFCIRKIPLLGKYISG